MATRCIVQEMKKLHEQGQADIRLVYTGHEAEDSGVLFGNACNLPISMAGRAYAALNNDLPLVRSLGVCFEGGAPSTRSPLMIQLATASVVVVEIVPSSKGLSPECHRLLGDATVLKYIYEKDVARLKAVVPSLERSTCVLLCQRIPGEPADMAAAMNIAIPHASQEAWVQPHLDTAYPTASAATTGGQLLDANGFGWFAAAGAFFTHQLGSMSEDLMPMERTHMEPPNTPSRRRTLPVRLLMSDSDDQNSDSSPGGDDEDDGCSSTLFGTLPPSLKVACMAGSPTAPCRRHTMHGRRTTYPLVTAIGCTTLVNPSTASTTRSSKGSWLCSNTRWRCPIARISNSRCTWLQLQIPSSRTRPGSLAMLRLSHHIANPR